METGLSHIMGLMSEKHSALVEAWRELVGMAPNPGAVMELTSRYLAIWSRTDWDELPAGLSRPTISGSEDLCLYQEKVSKEYRERAGNGPELLWALEAFLSAAVSRMQALQAGR